MSDDIQRQILQEVIEIKGDVGEIKSAVSSSHKRLDGHDRDIEGLKAFKWKAAGVITAVSTGIGMLWNVLTEWFKHNNGG